MVLPHVAVVGAGPAGLLTALFLTRRGFDVSVYESMKGSEDWSPRSYSIFLNERGQAALKRAGMLDAVRAASRKCDWTVVHHPDGSEDTVIPFGSSHLGITRPKLVQCLREQLILEGRVRIHDNSPVIGIRRNVAGHMLNLRLADGSEPDATHIVGADGKWSVIRDVAAKLAKEEGQQPFVCQVLIQRDWEILLTLKSLPKDWEDEGIHTIESKTQGDLLTGIVYQLTPEIVHAKLLLSDPILNNHVWLGSRSELVSEQKWEDNGGAQNPPEWERALQKLIKEELPVLPPESALGARLCRRESWMKVTVGGHPRFDSLGGRLVLVGDAAHSMTARLGESCNFALESAAALDEAIGWEFARHEPVVGSAKPAAAAAAESGGPTAAEAAGPVAASCVAAEGEDDLCMAFETYGSSRAKAIVQHMDERGWANALQDDLPTGPAKQ